MSAWIESHQTLWHHPRKEALAEALYDGMVPDDVADAAAIGMLQKLWWWALDYAQDGDLSAFSDRQIARGCEWHGDPSVFVNALTGSGFLNADRTIHDWQDYAGKLIERREKNRERMRRARSEPDNDMCDARASHSARTCGATQPNPTIQNRTLRASRAKSEDSAPSASGNGKAPKVSAPKDADWQERADAVLAATAFPSDYQQLAELLAGRNKTGKAQVSRVVRELYEPLLELEREVSREAMRAGLRAAIAKPAPNANYVKRAAESHTRSPVAATSRTVDRSDYDDFYTGGEA